MTSNRSQFDRADQTLAVNAYHAILVIEIEPSVANGLAPRVGPV